MGSNFAFNHGVSVRRLLKVSKIHVNIPAGVLLEFGLMFPVSLKQ